MLITNDMHGALVLQLMSGREREQNALVRDACWSAFDAMIDGWANWVSQLFKL